MKNGTVIPMLGNSMEIVVSSVSSNYNLVVGIETCRPASGPPPHRHLGEDETFTVLEGEFEFFDGGAWSPFLQGEVRYSLRGHYHAFRNVGKGTGKMMIMTNGGGLDEYFAAISSLELPRDVEEFQTISRHYHYEYLPQTR